MTNLKRILSVILTSSMLFSGISVYAENTPIENLLNSKTAAELTDNIANLTSSDCEELGLDFTDYNKVTYPEYIAEQMLISGFSDTDGFKIAFDAAVSKTLEKKKIAHSYGVSINEKDSTQGYIWKPGIKFANSLGVFYTSTYIGFDLENSDCISAIDLTLSYPNTYSASYTRGPVLYGYNLSDYPDTPLKNSEYSQDGYYDKSTSVYTSWADFHNTSTEIANDEKIKWQAVGTGKSGTYATVTNQINLEIAEAIREKESTSLSLWLGQGDNVSVQSNPETESGYNPYLTVTYDNSIIWKRTCSASIADGETGIYDLNTISLSYSAEIDPTLWNNENIKLVNTETENEDEAEVSLNLDRPGEIGISETLADETSYCLTVVNQKDLDGNNLKDTRIYFTTAGMYKELVIETEKELGLNDSADVKVIGKMSKREVEVNADINISDENVIEYTPGNIKAIGYGYSEFKATAYNLDNTLITKNEVILVPVIKEDIKDLVSDGAEIEYKNFAAEVILADDGAEAEENEVGFEGAMLGIGDEYYTVNGEATDVARADGEKRAVFVSDGENIKLYLDGTNIFEGECNETVITATGDIEIISASKLRFNETKPEIASISFSGNSEADALVGDILRGSYEYYDADGDASDGTESGWYISDEEDGEYSLLTKDANLEITNEHLNKYLKYAAIPKNAIAEGEKAETAPILVSLGKTLTKLLADMQNTDPETAKDILSTNATLFGIDLSALNLISQPIYVFTELAGKTFANIKEIALAYDAAINRYLIEVEYPVEAATNWSIDESSYTDVVGLQNQSLYKFGLYVTTPIIKNPEALKAMRYETYTTKADGQTGGNATRYYIHTPFDYNDMNAVAEKFGEGKETAALTGILVSGNNEYVKTADFPASILESFDGTNALTLYFANTGYVIMYLNGTLAERRPKFVATYDKTALMSLEAGFDIANGEANVAHDLEEVTINFYADVDETTVTDQNIYIKKEADGTVVSTTLEKSEDGTWKLKLNDEFENETNYIIVMENVLDADGNALNSQMIRFTTEFIAKSITLTGKTSYAIGESANLVVTGISETDNTYRMSGIVWESSDEAVAEISTDGTVTAKKRGTAVITAAYKNFDGTTISQKLIVNVYNKNTGESFETNPASVSDYSYSGAASIPVAGDITLFASEESNYAEISIYNAREANAAVSFGGASVSLNAADLTVGWHQIVFDNRGDKMITYLDGEKVSETAFSGNAVITASGTGIWADNANINDVSGTVCVAKNVAIRGSVASGSTLTVNYGYFDADNDPENGTVVKWYKSSSEKGSYTECGTGTTYKTSGTGYIKVGVTPQNIYDTGVEVLSPAFAVGSSGGGSGSSGTGGGGGGGGSVSAGASSQTIVSISTKEEQEEQQKYYDFADVPTTHWGYDAIMKMRREEIINGVGNNNFNPDGLVTKAEFAAMVIRALGAETKAYSGAFDDVSATDWYADTVETAYSLGLISGYDGKFNPNDNISREQMVKIIVEAYKTLNPDYQLSETPAAFADIEAAGEWSRQYIASASELGFVSGVGENMFDPSGVATRAQAAVIINNMLED